MVARFCLALAALGFASPALAEPLRLQPTSPWELREYDDKCRMIRTFGEGEDELTLWVDKGGPGPGVNITLIGRPVRSPYGAYVRVAFAPGEAVERNFITATSSKGRPVLGLFGVQMVSLLADRPEAPAAADTAEETVALGDSELAAYADEDTIKRRYGQITALEMSGGVINPITLELDRVLPMANELMACTNALTKRLAQDFAAAGGMGKGPQAVDAPVWAAKIQENYPTHLARTEQQGSVAVRLTIDKAGKPTFCEVTAYSGPAAFNETACLQLLRHAKFTPATDGAGNPVASFYSTRITYRLN